MSCARQNRRTGSGGLHLVEQLRGEAERLEARESWSGDDRGVLHRTGQSGGNERESCEEKVGKHCTFFLE